MKGRTEFRTDHGSEESAEIVASSVAPDNTDEIVTSVEGEVVVTRIEREGLGSMISTADDYIRNVSVAEEAVENWERD